MIFRNGSLLSVWSCSDSISVSTEDQKRQIAASIDRMKANLSLLRSNMEKLVVRAPADGVLSSFNVEIGETKNPGERLGQIDIMDGYKMRANIDERYVSRVVIGQEAEMDFSGKSYDLYVSKIYTGVTGGLSRWICSLNRKCP